MNTFADTTGDHQWIHIDVNRAKKGPFGGPIAHGYLTLALGPMLAPQIFVVSGISMGVNYGCGKVRFPSPVPVGSQLRLGVTLAARRRRARRCTDDPGVRASRSKARASRRASPKSSSATTPDTVPRSLWSSP